MQNSKWTRALTTLAIAVAGLSFAACSAQPGVAVSVGDITYTETQVEQGALEYQEMTGSQASVDRIVAVLPQWAQSIKLGEYAGIDLSDERVAQQLAAMAERGDIVQAPENPGPIITDLIRYTILQQELGALTQDPAVAEDLMTKYTELQETMPVEMNPRFGVFDSQTGGTFGPLFGDVVDSSGLSATGLKEMLAAE